MNAFSELDELYLTCIQRSSSKEDFLKEIAPVKDALDQGFRTSEELWKEVKNGDALIRWNAHTGELDRFARSVWVLMHDLTNDCCWMEVSRTYLLTNITNQKQQPGTVRESVEFYSETYLEGAAKGVRQELGALWKKVGYLPRLTDFTVRNWPIVPDPHPSTVYAKTRSHVKIGWADFFTRHIPKGLDELVANDTGDVENLIRPFPVEVALKFAFDWLKARTDAPFLL